MRDKGYISDKVSQPLLSFGGLLKHGWVISLTGSNESRLCHQQDGVSIPVRFQNDSLVVEGSIRRVFIRHVSADISQVGQLWEYRGRTLLWDTQSAGEKVEEILAPYRTSIAFTETG